MRSRTTRSTLTSPIPRRWRGAAYRPRHRTLDLWWRQREDDPSGRCYRYFDVPRGTFDALLAVRREGGSVGGFCNHDIKDHFRFAAMDVAED